MKKILAIVILWSVGISMYAQTDGITYQAVIIDPNGREMPGVDSEGNILPNTIISIRFTILDINNNEIYQEVQTTNTDQYGMINLLIGIGDPVGFAEINWDGTRKDLKVEVDFNNSGENYIGLSRQSLLFVPYAYHRNISAAGTLIVDGATDLNDVLNVNNSSPANFSGALTVDGETDLNSAVRVNNGSPITLSGSLTVMGKTAIDSLDVDGNLSVNGIVYLNNTISSNSKDIATLIVEGGVGIEKDLNVGQSTSIAGRVGIGAKADDDLRLRVVDSSSEHIVSIENTNSGEGDGLVIKLGKENAKTENWVEREDVLQAYFEEGMGQEDIDFLAKILTCGLTGVYPDWSHPLNWAKDYANAKVVDLTLATCKISEAIALSIQDILNEELSLPREYEKDMPSPVPDIKITLIPKLDIYVPPCNFGSFDFGLGDIPGFILIDNNYNTVLNNTNEYISFQDKNSFQLGAIKSQSLNDWASAHLNNMYAFDLIVSLVGIDLPEAILEAQGIIKELIYSYLNIGVEYSSGNGDYAEWLERLDPKEVITAGDIVAVKAGKITKDMEGAEQVMAISHYPIVLGNIPPEGKEYLGNNVAFMGQVPVKIMGAVVTGDYIVARSKIEGYGVAVSPQNMTIDDFKLAVGRSWESNLVTGPKMVNTVVGLHNGDYFNILKKYEQKFSESEEKFNYINARLEQLESKLSEMEK